MKIKGIIFDLDGTLMDSMHLWENLGANYLINRGLHPENKLNEKLKTLSTLEAARYFKKAYGIADSCEQITKDINAIIEASYKFEIKPKKYVPKLLEEFKNQGIKLYIATATEESLVKYVLKSNNLQDYFEGYVTCNQINTSKQEPDIFFYALNKLQTPKDLTLVVEDAFHAIKTAKNAGFKTVAIKDKSNEKDWQNIKNFADYPIGSFEKWSEIYE